MERLLLLFLAGMLQVSMASAAPQAQPKTEAAAETQPLKLRINGDPTTLDWNKQLDLHSERVSYQIMEGLISIDDQIKVHPALAKSWSVSKDKKIYTFHLKSGVKWTDGVDLEAQHFVDSVERVLNPSTAAPGSPLLFDLVGAEEYNNGTLKDSKQIGIKAKDKSTLIVELRRPLNMPPGVFDHPLAFPIRKDLIEKHKDQWTKAENLVTLGAYQLVSWQPGEIVRMKSFANYHGKKPKHKDVEFLIVADDLTALRLYEAGKVDMMVGLPVLDLQRLSATKDYKVYGQVLNNYIGFNLSQPPFNNPLVRKAFAHATDREQLAKLLGGGKRAAQSWIPSQLRVTPTSIGLSYNISEAKKLLKEAGYPDGKDFPRVTLVVNTSDENRMLAERLQSMWKENLGVTAEIEMETWKTYLTKVRSGNPPAIFRMGMGSTSFEPFDYAYQFVSTSPRNYAHWKNLKYDDLVSQAANMKTVNLKNRDRLYDDAQKILIEEEAAIIPVYESSLPVLANPKMAGLRINGRSKYLLKDL